MVNKVITAAVIGLKAYKVDVEVDVVNSLPKIAIVGLPDTAINEARDRVRSAVKNSGYTFPAKKVVVNLAPADLKKEGSNFDLPIAMGILVEEEVLDTEKIKDYAFIGELSLDGAIRPVNGVLPLVTGLRGVKNVIVPAKNAAEAALVEGITVFGAQDLNEVVNHFFECPIKPTAVNIQEYLQSGGTADYVYDFKDVKGQQKARRALEIAAAGAHNLLMTGSPGSGKTLMAKCFASILPPLELSEALELTKIYSICGLLEKPLMTQRPFRAVHHTASPNGIIGGGTVPKPGEITLAHRGVLFLDEMAEFPRNVLEVLRQPIEDGEIVISRTKHSIRYPAKFMLLGAMNPCPCGFLGDKEKHCTCSDFQVDRYLARLSGPLLDRIDLQINVPRLTSEELLSLNPEAETSAQIRKRVVDARKIQAQRYANDGILTNSELTPKLIKKYCRIDGAGEEVMKTAAAKYRLSGRRYDRILKLARTIADLDGSECITQMHLMQALQYRMFEKESLLYN
ncbi:MAG: YifB family Mg chelatase-like AAA ATPase [Heliobacteriaceae bacterium]|jgi:magnesium chelatase family protein|nr:YifB family Mg chelatase-like AAA ATPase [Heliobacteriaceae bacterium]